MRFIQFGQQNGNTRNQMLKAGGISNSSYKRWKISFNNLIKNEDDN